MDRSRSASWGTYAAALPVSRFAFHHDLRTSAIQALVCSFPDMAYFAAPVLAALFGPAGFLAVLLGNLVMLVLLPTTIILTQIDGPEAANAGRSVVIDSMVSAITNPIVWLPMLGVMLRFSGITLPHPLALSIDTIATSAGGTSLFALGLMLYGERVRFNANVLEKWLGLSEQPLTFDKWIVCGLVVQAAACGASWRSGVARPE